MLIARHQTWVAACSLWFVTFEALAQQRKDEDILGAARVSTDAKTLLEYFRQRTFVESDRKTIEEQLTNLGSRSFAKRERAFEDLKKRGIAAIPFLRQALTSPDLETRRRAERCLAEIERDNSPEVTAAVVRLLASKAVPEAVNVLIAYAPHAEDDNVEEALLEALVSSTPEKSRPDPSLIAALKDDHALRRAAAAYVLGRCSDPALQTDVRRLLADKEAKVRFRAAQGLLLGRDRSAIPALAAQLIDTPLNLAWQVEELLVRLAGESAPGVSLGTGDAETRLKCRNAWVQWALKHGERADLTRVQDLRRLLGLTLGIEYNTKRIWECTPDGAIRWEITNLHGPMEAWVLPGNRVLIADGNNVTERDFKGTILRSFENINSGPTGCQRLQNGNTFMSSYTQVMEFDKDGKKIYEYDIGGSNAIRKHRNGNVIYATDTHIIEMDTAGRRVRSIPLPRQSMYVGIEDIGPDRFLVANSNSGRVIEVDATGKILWEGNVSGACGVTRLPTGNTLVATSNRVVELDRKGTVVWEKKTTGYVRRVHRR
jgi:hypothetical protein